MSAREELFESLMPIYRAQYAPGEEDSTNAKLDAYRDEVVRDLVEAAREEMGPVDLTEIPEPMHVARFVEGWHAALNYIERKAAQP